MELVQAKVLGHRVESLHAELWEMNGNYRDALQNADIDSVIKVAVQYTPVLCDSFRLLLLEIDTELAKSAWEAIKRGVTKCRQLAELLEHVFFSVFQAPYGEEDVASKNALSEMRSGLVEEMMREMIGLTLVILEADSDVKRNHHSAAQEAKQGQWRIDGGFPGAEDQKARCCRLPRVQQII